MIKRLIILCLGISIVIGCADLDVTGFSKGVAYAEQTSYGQDIEKKKDAASKTKDRYVELFKDSAHTYYMDTRTAKWKICPRTANEQIIDVWIKLEKNGQGQLTTTSYSSDKKYYLEHYLIRPDKQQIQFLAELEVTGRPTNTIQEREYSVTNWEDLVPGSIEEEIYNAVLQNTNGMKHEKVEGNSASHDMIEDIFRISI